MLAAKDVFLLLRPPSRDRPVHLSVDLKLLTPLNHIYLNKSRREAYPITSLWNIFLSGRHFWSTCPGLGWS